MKEPAPKAKRQHGFPGVIEEPSKESTVGVVGKGRESGEVLGANGHRGLDFDADNLAIASLNDEIDLAFSGIPKMVDVYLIVCPSGMLEQFTAHQGLDQGTKKM